MTFFKIIKDKNTFNPLSYIYIYFTLQLNYFKSSGENKLSFMLFFKIIKDKDNLNKFHNAEENRLPSLPGVQSPIGTI